MIVIRVMGGLGNQLFQYALYYDLSTERDDVFLDVSGYTDDAFWRDKREFELNRFEGISFKECSIKQRNRLRGIPNSIFERVLSKIHLLRNQIFFQTKTYQPEVKTLTNAYLDGYWICPLYTKETLKEMISQIEFPKVHDNRNTDLLNKIKQENAVSIHIRGGDYKLPENERLFGNIATQEYYKSAIEYIRKTVSSPQFYLFTDDVEFARRLVDITDFSVIDWNKGKDSIYDMLLMSSCRYNICANSTFSIWAALLNRNDNKVMIKTLVNDHTNMNTEEENLLFWDEFVLINPEGKVID